MKREVRMARGNGNGSGWGGGHLTNIVSVGISTVVMLLALISGFWSLADPRTELKEIRSMINLQDRDWRRQLDELDRRHGETFLTIREHNEFVTRFNADVQRLESTDIAFRQTVTLKSEAEEHNKGDVAIIQALQRRIDQMQTQIDLLINRSLAPARDGSMTRGQ